MGYISFCDRCGDKTVPTEKMWIGDDLTPKKYESVNVLISRDVCANCKPIVVTEIEAIFKFSSNNRS